MRFAMVLSLVLPAIAAAGPTTGPVVTPVPTPVNPFPITFEMTVCSSAPSPPCFLESIVFQSNRTYMGGVGPWGPFDGNWAYYGQGGGVLTMVARNGTVFTGWGVPSPTRAQRCFEGVWNAPPSSTGLLASGNWDGCTVP